MVGSIRSVNRKLFNLGSGLYIRVAFIIGSPSMCFVAWKVFVACVAIFLSRTLQFHLAFLWAWDLLYVFMHAFVGEFLADWFYRLFELFYLLKKVIQLLFPLGWQVILLLGPKGELSSNINIEILITKRHILISLIWFWH